MSAEPRITANRANAQSSTSPATEAGKARVSQNALTHGLFSAAAFVHPDEHDLYTQFRAAFEADLSPDGPVQQTLVSEIIQAAWRLRRCGLVESKLAESPDLDSAATERTQNSIDRARAGAHRAFHRATAELRRLQTELLYRTQVLPEGYDCTDLGLASFQEITPTLVTDTHLRLLQAKLRNLYASPRTNDTAPVRRETIFAKQTQSDPRIPAAAPRVSHTGATRNAPCPCGSG